MKPGDRAYIPSGSDGWLNLELERCAGMEYLVMVDYMRVDDGQSVLVVAVPNFGINVSTPGSLRGALVMLQNTDLRWVWHRDLQDC